MIACVDVGEGRGSEGIECETGNCGRWFVLANPVEEDYEGRQGRVGSTPSAAIRVAVGSTDIFLTSWVAVGNAAHYLHI